MSEPFGYFKAEPFGWTDCAETDEGAVALYEHPKECKYPMCQNEEYQQALAEQIKQELYTGKPWVGLTNEERMGLWRVIIGWGDPSHDDEDLMKAIEAKLKEKNNAS